MTVFRKNRRLLLSFVCLFILCWMFPYTGDDWAWGSVVGLERLANHFRDYNGRYFGNLIVMALTRSNLLKSLTMAFCLTGILWCVQRMTKQTWSFFVCGLLLLLAPRELSQQAVIWTSGFSNYSVSVFLSLLYCCTIYDYFGQSPDIKLRHAWGQGCLLLLLGLCGAMIMETATLYNLFLSVFIVIYLYYRFRFIPVQHICYLAGTAAGAYLMFSNSAYSAIANGTGYYRTIPHSLHEYLSRAASSYSDIIYEQFFMNNLALNLAILLVMFLLYFSVCRQASQKSPRLPGIAFLCLMGFCAYWVYSCVVATIVGSSASMQKARVVEGVLTVFGFLSMALFSIICAVLTGRTGKILFILGSIVCMTAPLLFVTPIGPRNFYPSYIFFMLLFVEIAAMLPPGLIDGQARRTLSISLKMAITAAFACYLMVFSQIYAVTLEREAHITQEIANGADVVEVLQYPYRSLLWNSMPYEGSNLAQRYKYFYGFPQNITLLPVEQYSE